MSYKGSERHPGALNENLSFKVERFERKSLILHDCWRSETQSRKQFVAKSEKFAYKNNSGEGRDQQNSDERTMIINLLKLIYVYDFLS
jgi:hypothetical protein